MSLPRTNLFTFFINNNCRRLKKCKDTSLYLTQEGEVVKVLDLSLLSIIANTGYDLETRLKLAPKFSSFSSFAIPNHEFENYGLVCSYKMPYFEGVIFTDYYEDIYNLSSYASIHSQVEENIKKGNELGIVFPDLCTTENIIITPDKKVKFIDYDGLQIENMPAIGYSSFLGSEEQVLTPKYYNDKAKLFTKEIDVKSAIFLYFVDVFGIDLSYVGTYNPMLKRTINLDDIYESVNLKDPDIQHKVWKLFQEDESNEFLGDDLYKLAEDYDLGLPFEGAETKILIPKRKD